MLLVLAPNHLECVAPQALRSGVEVASAKVGRCRLPVSNNVSESAYGFSAALETIIS